MGASAYTFAERAMPACRNQTGGVCVSLENFKKQAKLLVRWHQWGIISVFCIYGQRTLWSSRNPQEDLGIGHECSAGRDELDCEF